jgi:hypothetical protein
MALATLTDLKASVADWLNRSDLTAVIPDFITLAEAALKRDPRVRRYEIGASLTCDTPTEALPVDTLSVEALYHDGPTHYGAIEIVSADMIGKLRGQLGPTGVPQYASVSEGLLVFAPAPDAAYTVKLMYWQTLTALSVSNTTNWLLTSHPDIYLYATLVESAPYLKDDPRIGVWRSEMEDRVMKMDLSNWNAQWGGTMRRQFSPFGG